VITYLDTKAHSLPDDNCYADGPAASQNAPKNARTDFVSRFGVMWKELQRVGIPGMLICQWGVPYTTSTGLQGPAQWTKSISTSFRLSDDITSGWASMFRIYNQAVHIAKSGLVGPGHIADADLLEVGNSGMTFDEQATHFAAWAMLKSALMISTDVAALSNELVAVLQNKDLIAINQDSAVKPVTLRQRWSGDRDLWAGDLANGDMAVLVVDLSNTARTLSLQLSELDIASASIKDLLPSASPTFAAQRLPNPLTTTSPHQPALFHPAQAPSLALVAPLPIRSAVWADPQTAA
jgi:alpha-galactosidase